MRKIIISVFILILALAGLSQAMPPPPAPLVVEEVDGSPSSVVNKILFTNGGVTITNGVASVSLTAGAGQPVTLTINGVQVSIDVGAIEVSAGDTNSIFTEATPDKLYIDMSKAWPVADQAKTGDSATAFFSAGQIELARGGTGADLSGQAANVLLAIENGASVVNPVTIGAGLSYNAGTNTLTATGTGTGDVTAASNLTTLALVQGDDGAKGVKTSAITLDANSNITIGGGAQASQTITGAVTGTDPVITFSNGVVNVSTGALQVGGNAVITTATTNLTPANLGATQTYSDGDLIDLSGITMSTDTNEGLILPVWANVTTTGVTNGAIAWDNASLALKVKSTGGWQSIGATAAPIDATYLTLSGNATLTGERVLTEGLAIDFTDTGADGTLTVAFDPTELTGDRTWAAGGAAAITWTWNNSGTDPSITFGNDLITVNNSFTVATGKTVKLGAITWNSGDNIDGTKVANADLGDITVTGGAWAVEDDSHAHTSTTLPATTAYTDAASQTFTGAAQAFGDADTDTLTIRSMIKGGNSREVQINAGARTAPTYPSATPTQDLYVKGNVEAAGTVYAAGFSGGVGSDGSRAITMASNTAFTPSGNQLYFLNNVLKVAENGTELDVVTPADSVTWTGASHSFAAVTNFVLPTATPDASGEIGIITGNILAWHDGAAVIKVDTTGVADGKILKWVAANGAFEVADDATAGAPVLSSIGNPSGDTTITMDAGEEVNFDFTGNFTTGSQFKIEQKTGNPSGGVLFEVKGVDTDITVAKFGDGTNGVTVSALGALAAAGTGRITATDLIAQSAIVPATAGGFALGSATAEWDHLYLHDGGVIYGQADQSNTLTSSATGWTTNLDLTVGGADLTLKSDGVKLTGSNGSLTILGLGDGQDEDVKIDLNTTANQITISSPASSADTVSFSALNLVTTGTITGAIKTEKDDDTLAAGQCYGTFHWYSGGAETITLPAAVVGMNLCIYSSDASVKNIDPNGTDTIVLTTAALTAGYQIESPGAAGDFICLVSFTANQWTALGRSGVWISHGAD